MASITCESAVTGSEQDKQRETREEKEMKSYTLDTTWGNVIVTSEDIDDIMCTSLEGGVTAYWCDRVEVDGDYLGEYAHEQISRDGSLIFTDIENGDRFMLTRGMLLNGIKTYINEFSNNPFLEKGKVKGTYTIDCGQLDAYAADMIVQYALFDEQVYG